MKTRIALIALLVLSAVAHADEEDAAEQPVESAARAVRAASAAVRRDAALVAREAAQAAADARHLTLRRLELLRGDAVRTETTVVVTHPTRLELESFDGDIVVSGWDRALVKLVADHEPGARVGLTVQPAAIVVRARGEVRVAELEKDRHARTRTVAVPVRVDYHLNVPRGMSLRLSGLDSEILVEGMLGDVSAQTVNGAVRVRGGRGTVRAEAIDGPVEIIGARGLVEASSMNDDVMMRDVEGRVRADAVRGDLELVRMRAESVEASTVSGDLRYEGSIRPGGEYHFESHSGDVTIVLPERPDAAVTVSTFGGSFQSSFPVPAKRPGHDQDFEFLLGDGRAELELASFSGAIRLLRAGDASSAPVRPVTPVRPIKPVTPVTPKTR